MMHSNRFGRGGKPAMNKATCDKCGNSCEVPFKPTGNRPVFCSDCFKKSGNANKSSNSRRPEERNYANDRNKNHEQFKEQFETLNSKLDRILKMLTTAPQETIKKQALVTKKEAKKKPKKGK